ncbi:unnamed protein product [Phyllotreta striolata]|uniref:BRISC and BRCA1-A complex member 1 n=1 Tax=Phyllotreta striolata TaxID=444603 RepID=A0A9N9TXG2_PHYSR|nr:unnamed protein product [Phyllotreta striolata]
MPNSIKNEVPMEYDSNEIDTNVAEESSNSDKQTEDNCSNSSKATFRIKPFNESKELEEHLRKYDEFVAPDIYSLPSVNVQEKIILVIDRANDEHCTSFKSSDDTTETFTPITMLKRALNLFLETKHSINKKHEYALILLNENDITWVLHFTSDVRKIRKAIDKITVCDVEDTFDMNLLFEQINDNVIVPEDEIPPYLIRTIIFYNRSYTIPKIEFSKPVLELLAKRYFICDVLYTHEKNDESNHCSRIFNCLEDMDKKDD